MITLIIVLYSALNGLRGWYRLLPHHFLSTVALGGGHVLHWAHSALRIGTGGVTWHWSHGWLWDIVGVVLMLHGLVEMARALKTAWVRIAQYMRSEG